MTIPRTQTDVRRAAMADVLRQWKARTPRTAALLEDVERAFDGYARSHGADVVLLSDLSKACSRLGLWLAQGREATDEDEAEVRGLVRAAEEERA